MNKSSFKLAFVNSFELKNGNITKKSSYNTFIFMSALSNFLSFFKHL